VQEHQQTGRAVRRWQSQRRRQTGRVEVEAPPAPACRAGKASSEPPPHARCTPQDKTLLSTPQRLALWFVLWDAFKGDDLADNPFIPFFIKVS
jgi:hypothetical protein